MSARCRSCRAAIEWATHSRTGASIPLDAEPHPDGNLVASRDARGLVVRHFDPLLDLDVARGELRIAHFVTCPNASTHRKKR